MLKQTKTFTVITACITMLALNSCQKEKLTVKNNSAFQNEEAKKVAQELAKLVWTSNSSSFVFKNGSFDCVTMTVDSISDPKTTTFDYGTGCSDEDGIVRKGIITLAYNNEDIQIAGTVVTYSFTGFFINNDEVKGTMTLENTGLSGNGFPRLRYFVDVQDHSLVNGVTQFDSEQFFEWIEGGNTWMNDDDVFSISGFFNFSTATGRQSLVTITDPLTKINSPECEHFVKGVTQIQSTDESDRFIDYGDGTCDNLAIQTIDGYSQTIELE
ncbi:MAG: hypothetical protein V4615_13395 [Bacteroidota bacterium]